MDYYNIIAERFQGTIESIAMSVDQLAAPIGEACEIMTKTLLQDGKIVVCGNGVDAALAQLFTASLLCATEQERPALPALLLGGDNATLTAIAASEGDDETYSRQLRALGQPGDTLLLISSGAATGNQVQAVSAARERNMAVIALSNSSDGTLPALLHAEDAAVIVDAPGRTRVLEIHTMVLHSFCQLIEHQLFGGYSQE